MFRKELLAKVGEYTRLAWRIANKKLPAKTIIEEVSTLGNEYPIEEAAEELRGTNCYHSFPLQGSVELTTDNYEGDITCY